MRAFQGAILNTVYINARKSAARPAVSAARMRVMLLAIVPAVNSGGDVAYLLQCRFYLHKVVDVELHGIAVLLPHLAGYEDGIMQRPLGLFQSGLQVVHGVLPVLRRRYSPGTVFCREILFCLSRYSCFRPK